MILDKSADKADILRTRRTEYREYYCEHTELCREEQARYSYRIYIKEHNVVCKYTRKHCCEQYGTGYGKVFYPALLDLKDICHQCRQEQQHLAYYKRDHHCGHLNLEYPYNIKYQNQHKQYACDPHYACRGLVCGKLILL